MRGWVWAALVLLAGVPSVVFAQGATSPLILAPTAGQVLQGQVSIVGTTDVPDFASAELDFAYASDSTHSWFQIEAFSEPVANSTLSVWDTASISDGDYILRLRVTLLDASFQDATVRVRVQNQTPLPTVSSTATPTVAPSPAPSAPPSTAAPILIPASPTSTSTPVFSTPTTLPSNPVEIQPSEIYAGVQRGALAIVGLFIFFGILMRLRRS